MKIMTLRNSDWLEWHKTFLFLPKRVFICEYDPLTLQDDMKPAKHKICLMWLCFVKRIHTPHRTMKWIYWMKN